MWEREEQGGRVERSVHGFLSSAALGVGLRRPRLVAFKRA